MKIAIVLVLLGSLTACNTFGMRAEGIGKRAALDLKCPESKIKVIELERTRSGILGGDYKHVYHTSGCEKRAVYDLACNGWGSCQEPVLRAVLTDGKK